MNKKLFSLVAAFSMSASFAAPAPTPTRIALDKVDQGGEYLFVGTMSKEYKKFVNEIPDAATPQQRLQQKILRQIYRIFGVHLLQSQAISSKETIPGCWVYKSYHYLGKKNMQIPSVYNTLNTGKDRRLDLVDLPANTLIALSFDVRLANFYAMLRKEFMADPDLKGLIEAAESSAKANKIDLNKLLASLDGTIKLCIAGSSPSDLAIRIEIPDRYGEVAALIRREMQLSANAAEATLPLFFMPVKVKFNHGSISLANPTPLSTAEKLAQTPAFANYLSLVGTTGNSYGLINVTPQLIASLNAMMPKEIKNVLNLSPFSAIMIGKYDPEGVYCIGAGNFSITKCFTAGATTAFGAMLLPALSSARDRARQVSCVNNLKQIGLALMLYANDFQNKLPAGNGIKGLQILLDKEYASADIFSCPSNPAVYQGNKLSDANPYIYIGGIYGTLPEIGGKFPLAFEKPGNHKNRVNVLFADGHVRTLTIPGYNNPAQVIGILNKENKYAPELLDKMIRAVAEN